MELTRSLELGFDGFVKSFVVSQENIEATAVGNDGSFEFGNLESWAAATKRAGATTSGQYRGPARTANGCDKDLEWFVKLDQSVRRKEMGGVRRQNVNRWTCPCHENR